MEDLETNDIGGASSSDGSMKRFVVGDLVEVRMTEPGLRGSWHAAVIVEVQKGARLVEYEHLLEDDEKSKLREKVPVGRASDGDNLMATLPLKSPTKKTRVVMRPRPPVHHGALSWTEGTWVECFYEDAWWEGAIMENVTTVSVEDVYSITRKSEVDVFFPEENDVTKMRVDRMRIGQEWDEETGLWSLRGCAPVPVLPKKPSKKNSRHFAEEVVTPVSSSRKVLAPAMTAKSTVEPNATEKAGCESMMLLSRATTAFNAVDDDAGYKAEESDNDGYMETLRSGGSKSGAEAKEELPLSSSAGTGSEILASKTNVDDANTLTQDEVAARAILTRFGWKVTRTVRKKSGLVIWNCRSPKISGVAKSFSSLVQALTFEAERGPSGGEKVVQANNSQVSCYTEKVDVVKESFFDVAGDRFTRDDVHENHSYAVPARKILMNSGWEVIDAVSNGEKGALVYRSPARPDTQTRNWFTSWRLAVDDLIKTDTHEAEEKKRGEGGRKSSPLAQNRRVSRRQLSLPEAGRKPADVLGRTPIAMSKKGVPNSAVRNASPADKREMSDLDDDDRREVDVIVNSCRKRARVDLGQKSTRFNGATPVVTSHLEMPFGSISNVEDQDNAYILQVVTHDFSKEQVRVFVEGDTMTIKARYGVDRKVEQFSIRCSGSLIARVTLPKNVEQQLITAEWKSPFLILTLPKSSIAAEDILQIFIQ